MGTADCRLQTAESTLQTARTITVGGASSGCGKTSAAVLLIRALPGWAAIKVTPCHPGQVCPLGCDCGACAPPPGKYEITSDPAIIAQPGKDTARFVEAGASEVVWVRALPEFLPEAIEAALGEVAGAPGIIVESTTAMSILPGLHVLVVRQGVSQLKKSASRNAECADFVLFNVDLESVELGRIVPPEIPWAKRIIPMCAVLSHDHPFNREFFDSCGDLLASG